MSAVSFFSVYCASHIEICSQIWRRLCVKNAKQENMDYILGTAIITYCIICFTKRDPFIICFSKDQIGHFPY